MRNSLVALGAACILAGCASGGGAPTLQTGPDAEITADGLYKVDNSVMALAWMKPDMDLRPYTAIMIDPVEVAYQTDPGNRRTSRPGDAAGNFALTAPQMEDFKSVFRETIVEALSADDGYEIVDAPGLDVLRISAALIDLIIRVPTQRDGGRGGEVTRSYGEVTLVVDGRDSQSGEIIARVADRRDPTRPNASGMARVDPGMVRNDMRLLFRSWAEILRERLDALREFEAESDQ